MSTQISKPLYLSIGDEHEEKGFLCVISAGSPIFGDTDITVLCVDYLQSHEAAREWFKRMQDEQPWARRANDSHRAASMHARARSDARWNGAL
jgi:hypothetical protein